MGCLNVERSSNRPIAAVLQMMAAFDDADEAGFCQDLGNDDQFALAALSSSQAQSDWSAIYPDRDLFFYLSGYIHIGRRTIFADAAKDLIIEVSQKIFESLVKHGMERFHELSGSYLMLFYKLKSRTLYVVTDRLASRPLFYARKEGKLFIASDLQALLQIHDVDPRLDLCSVTEYLRFGTVFENRTLYADIKSVPSASILTAQRDGVYLERYWSMTYNESWQKPDQYYIEALVEAFKSSIGRLADSFEKSALLLSGGLDSRMIAAAIHASGAQVKVISFGGFENDEVKLARRVAKACDFPFSFLKRVPDYYRMVFPETAHIGNGMFPFYHAHMLGLHDQIQAQGINTLLHGWGLDVLFSATFLPKQSVHHMMDRSFNLIWPRVLDDRRSVGDGLYSKLALPSDDLIEKLPGNLLKDMWRCWPREVIFKLVDNARHHAGDYYNQYEWMLLHDISRFRSFLYPLSMRWRCRERCPLYDSQIIDVYLSMPPQLRFCSRAYGRALEQLSKPLARIPYSRTGVSVRSPEIVQTCAYFLLPATQAARSKGRVILGRHRQYPEEGFDSYPKIGVLLRQESFRIIFRENLSTGILGDLGLVEEDVLRQMLDDHFQGRANYGEMLAGLLSLARWLTQWS